MKSLSNVLRDIDDVAPARELTLQQRIEFEEVVQGVRQVLKELEDLLDKYQELAESPVINAGTDGAKLGGSTRARRIWKRLKFDSREINAFRDKIASCTTLLVAFLGKINT